MSRKGSTNDGDWVCGDPKCGNVNFSRRHQCNRCGAEKSHTTIKAGGTAIGKQLAEKSKGLFSADDWQCKTCGNVNWARRSDCNLCKTPKFGKQEARTGYGGGYNERLGVEYKSDNEESDGEFDDFGRKKKKFRGSLPSKPEVEKNKRAKEEEEEEEEEESGDDGDLDAYRLESDEEDDDDDEDLSKYDLDADDDIPTFKPSAEDTEKTSRKYKASRSRSRSPSGSSGSSSSSSRSSKSSGSRSSSGSSSSSRSRSRSRSSDRRYRRQSGSRRSRTPEKRQRSGSREMSDDPKRMRHRSRSR